MAPSKIAFISGAAFGGGQPNTDLVEQQLAGLDYEMDVHVCSSPGEAIEAIKGADVIINQGVPMSREVIEAIDTAQAVVSSGHGFDRIDHDAATDKSVMIVNTAGFCTEEVSNHAIMLLLACAKNLVNLHNLVREGEWSRAGRPQWRQMGSIDGQTLGLVGLGNIARATARKASVFGLQLIAYDPYIQPWIAKEYKVGLVSSLEELAGSSDYVSVHVPLNNETRKLLSGPFFKAMKPTAYLINTCRGPTVDEAALIKALQDGELAGAGLDVFEVEPTPGDNPLLKMDNVIVTPHSAGGSTVSGPNAQRQIGQEAARLLKGMWPMSLVNPEVRAKISVRNPSINQ